MKNWILIAVVALSFAVLAQPGKGKGKGNSQSNGKSEIKIKSGNKNGPVQIKGKSGNVKFDIRQNGNGNKGNGSRGNNSNNGFSKGNQGNKSFYSKNAKNNHAKHAAKFHYKKGHPNSIYLYVFSPFTYPTKNYGQWRSEQARNKHKKYKPVKQKDATEAIILIRNRNAFLLVEIDDKFARLQNTLRQRHDAGLITDVQFSIHFSTIQALSLKRNRYSY